MHHVGESVGKQVLWNPGDGEVHRCSHELAPPLTGRRVGGACEPLTPPSAPPGDLSSFALAGMIGKKAPEVDW